MKENRICKTVQGIIKGIRIGRDIREEQVYALWEDIAVNLEKNDLENAFEVYEELEERIDSLFAYRSICKYASEQSFLLGGIWGGLHALRSILNLKKESRNGQLFSAKYREETAFLFLRAIHAKPGINGTGLAQICRVSEPRITQLAKDAAEEGLITAQKSGREKYYYLRTQGENVYASITAERKPVQTGNIKGKHYYDIYTFDNQTDISLQNAKTLINNLSSDLDLYEVKVAVAVNKKSCGLFLNQGGNKAICRGRKKNSLNGFTNLSAQQKEKDLIRRQLYITQS